MGGMAAQVRWRAGCLGGLRGWAAFTRGVGDATDEPPTLEHDLNDQNPNSNPSPQIPIKNDPAANAAALTKVKADKMREVKAGHDGTWVAHPDLVKVRLTGV
jgi:hypothetical protein